MPLDLSDISEFLEEEMEVTEITVSSDPEGVTDDTFDPVTLEFLPPNPDEQEVYSGKALIVPDNNQPAPSDEGGAKNELTFYRMRLPLSAPRLRPLDRITVTRNDRDANMVGAEMYVIDVTESSFAVSANYQLKRKRQSNLAQSPAQP